MNRLLLLFSLLLLSISLSAQPGGFGGMGKTSIKGKITGVLIDTLTKEPIPYATIALKKKGSDKIINGVITDEKGKFKLEDVTLGKYQVHFSFLGYQTKVSEVIELSKKDPDLKMGNVRLKEDSVNLEEVVVTEEASVIENKVDKIVYHAEKDVTAAGGDATDVLRKVPLLTVDLDGNVSLRGSTNLRILINGKPSGMFSSSVADALKMIPADQIKDVEVITTPTAKYDGEGSGGIVNIITKKKSPEGFSGSVNGSVGTRQNNGVVNLNVAKGRFGFNTSGSSWYSWPRDATSEFLRTDQVNGVERTLTQNGITETGRVGFNGKAGAYYDFNAYNTLSTSISTNGFSFGTDGTTDATLVDPFLGINQEYTRTSIGDAIWSGYDWTTDYRRTFDSPSKEFSMAFQLNGNVNDRDTKIDQFGNLDSLFIDEINFNKGRNLEGTFQTDYKFPLSKKIIVELGAKGVRRAINSDYQYDTLNVETASYRIDMNRSNNFDYRQDVYAGYTSFNFVLGKNYGLNIGARYEFTDIAGELAHGGDPFSSRYDNFLPSVILSKRFKNFSTIKASYNKRIQRPSLFFINPFVDTNDPRNLSFGNPELQPEITHQVELSYSAFVKGISIYTAFFYKKTDDIIESFLRVDNEGISSTTFLNIGENNSIGFNFFGGATIKNIWQVRGGVNISTYNTRSTGELDLQNSALLLNGNLGSTLSLKKGFKIEMFGFLQAPRQTIQGKVPSFSMLSIGAKKEIFKKRGSIGINIIEPFVRDKSFKTELAGPNFYQVSDFVIPFRSFGINFSYKFGKLDFKQRRNKSSIKNDDLKQGEDGGGGGGGGGGGF